MPCSLGADGWHGHGHWGNVAACHSGDKGVLSPGHRVSGHLWSRCESLQERSSGSPSWLCGFPSQLQHAPQRRGSGSASAASSANSKFHSHLWKEARITKIRLATVLGIQTTTQN